MAAVLFLMLPPIFLNFPNILRSYWGIRFICVAIALFSVEAFYYTLARHGQTSALPNIFIISARIFWLYTGVNGLFVLSSHGEHFSLLVLITTLWILGNTNSLFHHTLLALPRNRK